MNSGSDNGARGRMVVSSTMKDIFTLRLMGDWICGVRAQGAFKIT